MALQTPAAPQLHNMDPRVYGNRRQDNPSGQRGRQDDAQRGKPSEEPFGGQRGRHDELFGQRGKQAEEPFGGPRGRQEDSYGQKGKQPEEPFGGQTEKGKQQDPFGLSSASRGQDSPRRHQQESSNSKRPMEESQRATTPQKPYAQLEFDEPDRHFTPSYPGGEHAELHEALGPAANPAIHTMVKMVTMLNFMKVELGETKTLRSKEQWRAAGAEFIGTLLFVYLGCGSVVATGMLDSQMTAARLVAIALAHGLAISFLAGATGAISGGHLNPAVTLAFVVAGKESLVRAGLYVGSQVLGAIFGALLLKWSTPESMRGTLGSHDINPLIFTSQGFLMELMLTFVLVFVIFGVAVDRRGPGVIAPIPIGFAVLVDHLVGVPYTGASMNPARSFGPAIVSGSFGSSHLVYWAAPGFGATFASALYRYIFLEPAEAAFVAAHPTEAK